MDPERTESDREQSPVGVDAHAADPAVPVSRVAAKKFPARRIEGELRGGKTRAFAPEGKAASIPRESHRRFAINTVRVEHAGSAFDVPKAHRKIAGSGGEKLS